MKLLKITKSTKKDKKYTAYFSDGTHTDFGAKGYEDYTTHKDEKRKKNYIARHKSNEDWSNFKSAGALSRFVLWNKTTLKDSIADYKRRFGL